ncbi:alpha-amylase family glycosyl hydrolase [Virgibacillus sp. W0181]|uniref:alpha-amylase family glycosyl hydrolase n=1 Tax=Virgibacillus sp. W0181 TaxID=3391581 RepID=UPI003F48F2C1
MKKTLFIIATILLLTTHIQAVHADESKENTELKEQIIYNIFIDRFNNGGRTLNAEVDIDDPYAYQGGDLKGITMKLDDLKKLGFTAISISPIMDNAPDGYHGYWVEDFFGLEEQFGTMDDLHHLVEEAHQRNMKVIVEFVTNYVSLTHPLVSDPNKRDWTKEISTTFPKSANWIENTAQLNQSNEQVASYLMEAADYWMKETDIDGFKLHAADQASPDFLQMFTSHIKETNPEFYLLAGVLQKDSDITSLRNNEHIDAVENYNVFEKINEILIKEDKPVSEIYNVWENEKNEKDLLFVDNKNTARFSNNFADNGRNALTTWKLALTYLYTAQGTPVIFQGSELPMYGPSYLESRRMVQFQNSDPDLAEFHERISAIRSEFPALAHGEFTQVDTNEGMSVFKRSYQGEEVYIALNNDSESRTVTISGIDSDLQLRGLLGDNLVRENDEGIFRIGIPRETAEVFITEPNKGFNWGLIAFVAGVFVIFIVAVIMLSRKDKHRHNK